MNRLRIIKQLWDSPREYWELAANSGENGLDFVEMMNSMNGREIVPKNGKFRIGNRKKYEGLFKKDFKKEIKIFRGIAKQRPSPDEGFYQDFLGTEDIFRRVKLMHDLCDVQNKRVAVLGDDDLFSIALGLADISAKTDVFEIDKRVVDVIKSNARKKKLDVRAYQYNIADPVPAKLRGKYDVVVTEPVETIEGLKIWLSRCAELLKKGGVLYFGLTVVESPFSKWLKIQKMLNSMGFAVTDIKRDFSVYPHSQLVDDNKMKIAAGFKGNVEGKIADWYKSWLYRCEAVENPKPIVRGKKKLSRSFYYDKYFLGK